jgi:spore maturation protein CgeB
VKFVLFYHSLVSDWNHGNAHFLRGVVTELLARGHEVRVCEPRACWSRDNLVAERGVGALEAFGRAYPGLSSVVYGPAGAEVEAQCEGADVIIAHEWNEPGLISALGKHRREHPGSRLLFHDTHHRALTRPVEMAAYDLSAFDGALVYGRVLERIYRERGWAERVWVWHEAADTRVFRPLAGVDASEDLVWVGNWGDDERTAELREFLLEPCAALDLRATVYGVRYPAEALEALAGAGVRYGGHLLNFEAPRVFAGARMTVHIPRRPYVEALKGIPTIRVFEALACGVPLICSPWEDAEGLFRPGDYLVARSGREMTRRMRELLHEPGLARRQAERGLETILSRHTCGHRLDELLRVCAEIGARGAAEGATGSPDADGVLAGVGKP